MSAPTTTMTQTHYDPNFVDMMRGTPPPTWEQTCLNLEKKLTDSRQHITELEGRLRVLWDKLENERKYYDERIKRLEAAGDAMESCLEGWAVGSGVIKGWLQAKEAKP